MLQIHWWGIFLQSISYLCIPNIIFYQVSTIVVAKTRRKNIFIITIIRVIVIIEQRKGRVQ